MRKYELIALIITILSTTFSLYAQTDRIIAIENMPKAEKYLPQPPQNGTPGFFLDSLVYENGKKLRDTYRGTVAVQDAKISVKYYMKRFGDVMSHRINPDNCPVLAEYIQTTYRNARFSIESTKHYFSRQRPYQYFKEGTPIPEDEDENDFTSYPSGHSVRAWAIALALISVDPEHQEDILRVGLEICESRTIVGYHYQSDIQAAIIAASAAYAKMSTSKEFRELQKAAIAEFQNF
ncbi:MAG: phosphatase PAP2 family protein [Bacteroidales bacterium]|nr:phosphatase PAP2 family protein [Bacteroidales bacterium]